MSIWARKPKSEFTPAPEGLHQAICVDVIDLGMKDTLYGIKHKVRFRWQLEDRDESGHRFFVQQDYTLSLHEQSNLRKHLESWRGRQFTDAELDGFDLETTIGANCQIQIVHNETSKGGIWANVQTIVPASKNMAKMQMESYTREKDRPKDGAQDESFVATDEDVPF